jgi:class 3 adenylate cyclase/tetratricopeptide (TPR) repeat protein
MVRCPSCGEENPERFRLCGFCGTELAPAAAPPPEVRKIVTIVFSDLAGSTALGERLDPESLREVLARYFERMRTALEEHGGVVEKYIGDAVMAVFGLPQVHEDDALRAVRAAHQMRTALVQLNEELEAFYGVRLTNRTGVNTGEVIAGDASLRQRLVSGDAVNVAARLEQAAPGNEVLISASTRRLVRDVAVVEEVEPLELKGKSERVPAYRLLDVRAPAEVERPGATELVGREGELGLLRAALSAAEASRTPRLATVVGEPGIGKSRLVDALVDATRQEAAVVRGRCLSYGRGITFWPLTEIVRDAAAISDDDPPEVAREKLAALVPESEEAAERVASAVGLSAAEFPLDEITWGTRKLLEGLARERPLLVVVDDAHWAEDAFLDLLEQVASAAHAPILVLAVSRPDLFDRRPAWCTGEHTTRIELGRLTPAEVERMIDDQLGDGVLAPPARRRIVEVAEGNPLYVEQLLSMLIDEHVLEQRDGVWTPTADITEISIPLSIQALLTARLELLGADERALLEPASVIGAVFAQEAVEALAPEHLRGRVPTLLLRLEADEPTLRFHHVLIRDATYVGLLKRSRAGLHERFADWAEERNREREREAEYEEILGYHLEQAHRYLSELGPLDEHGRAVGARAAARLGAAGIRAFGRGDMAAASNLLRRAVALLPEQTRDRVELLPYLAEAMQEIGEFAWAVVYADEAIVQAAAIGDVSLGADAALTRLLVDHHVTDDLDAWRAEVDRETARLIPLLDEETSPAVLAKAWRMVSYVHGTVCRWQETALANQRALHHARTAGDRSREARAAAGYAHALGWGPTPVADAIARLDEILTDGLVDGRAEAIVLLMLGQLHAMAGRFQEGRGACARACGLIEDRGGGVIADALSIAGPARVELLAGAAEAAEELLRRDYDALTARGERYYRPLVAAVWAQVLYELGRFDDAEVAAASADELASEDDVEAQAIWRSARAKLLARAGRSGEALELAEQAVVLLRTTDSPVMQADALLDLAHVQSRGGWTDDAVEAAVEARLRYGLKGHVVGAERAEAFLAALGRPDAWAAHAEARAAQTPG